MGWGAGFLPGAPLIEGCEMGMGLLTDLHDHALRQAAAGKGALHAC